MGVSWELQQYKNETSNYETHPNGHVQHHLKTKKRLEVSRGQQLERVPNLETFAKRESRQLMLQQSGNIAAGFTLVFGVHAALL